MNIRDLLAAVPAGPYTLDTSLGAFAATIRTNNAPEAVDVPDDTLHRALHHAILHFRSATDGKAVHTVLTALPALLEGNPTTATWEAVDTAWSEFGVEGLLVGEVILDEDLTIERGHQLVEDGARRITARTRSKNGRLKHRLIGLATLGDGSDPIAIAELMAALPTVVPRLLAETQATCFFSSAIDGRTIVVDAADRAIVEDPERSWVVEPGGVIDARYGTQWPDDLRDRKTGQRLADILLGTDGEAFRTAVLQPEVGDIDYRRSRLRRQDRRQPHSVLLAPEALDRLTATARARDLDAGALISEVIR